MGRNKVHESNAARQRFYRKSLTKDDKRAIAELNRLFTWKEQNAPNKSKLAERARERRERASKTKSFIAIDGEGYNRLNNHLYTMLSSSECDTIEQWNYGLSTLQCFEFLHRYYGRGILVGFYTSYDINMMLHDLDYESLTLLWNQGYVQWGDWHIEWMPSKLFKLTKDHKQIVWFDVFAFFQKSFIKALIDWQIISPEKREYQSLEIQFGDAKWDEAIVISKGEYDWYILVQGKEHRGKFSKKEREVIKEYNLTECKLLVKLMNKLRDTCIECGYLPRSWHGAGALANEILKQNRVAESNCYDEQMQDKFLAAYYGGRNQVLQQGEVDEGFTHDINSAYPYSLTLLPSTHGVWRKISVVKQPDNSFCLYKVKWKIPSSGAVITPFPFRYKQAIYWPFEGCGWYWQPEVEQALRYYAKYIQVLECWTFEPATNTKPFAFISDLYNQRRRLLSEGNDGQIVLKLGINACYGKVAQSIGYNGSNPPYQNYFWAGWITSKTRAMVFELAMKNPDSIISFATDGVMATEKLISHDLTKELGGWSVDQISNLLIIQPGVYTYDNAEHTTTFKSRGFSHRSVDYDALRVKWREDGATAEYKYSETRFIGLGSCIRNLRNWRRWIRQERVINFEPNGHTTLALAKNLRVYPIERLDANESEPYKKKTQWLSEEDFAKLEC